MFKVKYSLFQIVVFNHQVRCRVILSQTFDALRSTIWLLATSASSGCAASWNSTSDEHILQVFQFVLQLGIFKHDIFKVSFSQILCKPNLIIFLSKPFEFNFIFAKEVIILNSRIRKLLLLLLLPATWLLLTEIGILTGIQINLLPTLAWRSLPALRRLNGWQPRLLALLLEMQLLLEVLLTYRLNRLATVKTSHLLLEIFIFHLD